MKRKPSFNQEAKEKIEEIASYIFPVYKFEDKEYIPLPNALHIRGIARTLLGRKDE